MKAFSIVFSIVFFIAVFTSLASATDPICLWTPDFVIDPDPLPAGDFIIYEPVDLIDAVEPPGAFEYCTPTWDNNGLGYPATGYPMACEVRLNGAVLDRQEGLAPGQLVPVVGLTVRWDVDELQIACENKYGTGVAFARPATFPGSAPDRPNRP